MPEGGSIEYQRSELQIPKEFEDIKNLQAFRDVYADIVDWYGEDFNNLEKKLIKEVWNSGCNEFRGNLTGIQKAILKNRVDFSLFEHRYPQFADLDKKVIRTMPDASMQRKYRGIATKLYKAVGLPSDEDVLLIKNYFISCKNNKKSPNFDEIIGKLKGKNIGPAINTGNVIQNDVNVVPNIMDEDDEAQRIELERLLKLSIPMGFSEMKKDLGNVFDPNVYPHAKRAEGYVNKILSNLEIYQVNELSSEEYHALYPICRRYGIQFAQGDFSGYEEFRNKVENILCAHRGDSLIYIALRESGTYDAMKYVETDFDGVDIKRIEFLQIYYGTPEQKAKGLAWRYKDLLKRQENGEQLTEQEQEELLKIDRLFRILDRKIKLQEIRKVEMERQRMERGLDLHESVSLSGNLQSMGPRVIVENNDDVRRFVYGKRGDRAAMPNQSEPEHSLDYDAELYDRLVEQRRGDPEFMATIKYIKKDGSIDMDLVNQDGVDLASVQNNQREVQSLLTDMAREDFHDENMRNRINDISTRKSIMTCCFRAISQYFDKTNGNGENFAHEFQLDVNSDISFDGDIISMKGMMGSNYVGLYYDVSTGMLSFDNFLDFDVDNKSYVLGTNNGRKELMNIKLPTMNEMMNVANTVDFANISSNVEDMHEYRLSVEHAVDENVWNACFMGMDMLNNRSRVELFNEKNLLKQDIIRNIYTNYYNSQDLDVLFSGKFEISAQKPEQYKLIGLIYRSISNCKSAEELLKFRNLINNLDNLLGNSEVVEGDSLLQYLFADNVYDKNDIYDQSRNIVEKENGEIPLGDDDAQGKIYERNDVQNPNNGNAALNYYTLLDLISEGTGEDRIINLSAFESMVTTLSKKGQTLKDLDNVIYVDNLLDKQISGELPGLEEENQYTFA